MNFKVLKDFKAETPSGILTLKEEQKIKLSKAEAIPLIESGMIIPIEKVAYRIYSEILQSYLWVVDTNQDMHLLRSQGISEAAYTTAEIRKLKGTCKDSLKVVHEVKTAFPESRVENIKKKGDN